MALLNQLVHHPRKLMARKVLFQVHLWTGIFLTAYLVVIALSGSVLVFETELTALALRPRLSHGATQPAISIVDAVQSAEHAYPGASIDLVTLPTRSLPAYRVDLKLADEQSKALFIDPLNREILSTGTWVQWVHDLHIYLLLNERIGMQVNAIGAAILLLLLLTGAFLWWPGIRAWRRGLRINFRANWRRINYDAHHAIGFWTCIFVFWWAFSGVYFGFYKEIAAAVNLVSTIKNMKPPPEREPSRSVDRVALGEVLSAAQAASPHAHLYSLSNPLLVDTVVFASMDLEQPGDFTHRDIVKLDASNGRVLSSWHYSEKQSFGDWILWLMHPLHFGTLWGIAVKIVWAASGVLLAALAISGLLMYWNRSLRHLVRRSSDAAIRSGAGAQAG